MRFLWFHSAGFVSHTVKYISHTVVFVFHSVKQRIVPYVLQKSILILTFYSGSPQTIIQP